MPKGTGMKKYWKSMPEAGGFQTVIFMVRISCNIVLIGKRITPMEMRGLLMRK